MFKQDLFLSIEVAGNQGAGKSGLLSKLGLFLGELVATQFEPQAVLRVETHEVVQGTEGGETIRYSLKARREAERGPYDA